MYLWHSPKVMTAFGACTSKLGKCFDSGIQKNTQQQRHPPPPPLCFSHMHAKEPLQVNYWLVFTQSAADKQVCN